MDKNERAALRAHAETLDKWYRHGTIDKPSVGMLCALQEAVDAMQAEQARTGSSYARPCAVLLYHIKEPTALLFRDLVTLTAIKTAIRALERKAETR